MNVARHHAPAPRSWRRLRPWRRHSLVLLIAGVIYFLLGLVLAFVEPTPTRESALRVIAWAPWWAWGLLWMVAGAAAVVSSRWPEGAETWGYSVVSGVAALWAAVYVGGFVLGAGPSSFSGALVYALLGLLWWAISGLVNPDEFITGEG